jgi:hypothetical protein
MQAEGSPVRRFAVVIPVVAVVAALLVGAAPAPKVIQAELQAQIDDQLRRYPGGEQISANAVSYDNGEVTVVFPTPGTDVSPGGIGGEVRTEKLTSDTLKTFESRAWRDVHGCPEGLMKKWYCFYENRDFKGRRWQFQATTAENATAWGFNDQTSSWVNTRNDLGLEFSAYDRINQSGLLWQMPRSSEKAYVGNESNDRMSSWKKTS